MKKKLLWACVLLLGSQALKAQTAAKSIYFELGGPGLASFNFDTRFSKKENGIGGRIGFGGISIDGSTALFIPIGLNYLIGKDTKNYFEVGAGVTPLFASSDFSDDGDVFRTTFGHLNFGYRYQTPTPGFTFRAGITPIFGSFGFFPYYASVSFGYKF